ncbi:MAG: SUMF1/EgtB/PvdO family nonheme iron enzyme [Ignavibacteriales bacterium]|nr:SUMF1/EgtB/PvdO family nonheme iron enzyme [Ignavibacteriales bacterium]
MKRTFIFLLFLGMSFSAYSQTKMFINKNNGTTDSLFLSDVKSISFKSGSSTSPLGGMIPVAGGTFTVGTTPVTISSFTIDKYEVTFEKWTEVRTWALTNGYTDLAAGKNGHNPIGTNNPVDSLNWFDIVKWCNARSEKDGLTPVYYTTSAQSTVYRTGETVINTDAVKWTANGYRLPTETEWDFAARGGNSTQGYTYSGSNTFDNVAWCWQNSPINTHTVGTKMANELGIYDMSGNVWEMVWDWYSSTYPSGTTDPKGPSTTQSFRVFKGGSFDADGGTCAMAYRIFVYGGDFPNVRQWNSGFRCVQD